MKPLCLFYLRSRALQRLALCLGKAKVNIFMMIFFILQRHAFVWQISFSRLMLAFAVISANLSPFYLTSCIFINMWFFLQFPILYQPLHHTNSLRLFEGRKEYKKYKFSIYRILLYCIISRAHRSGTGTLHTMSLKKRPVADG